MERIERQAEESQTNTPHDHEQNQHKPSTIGTKQQKTAQNRSYNLRLELLLSHTFSISWVLTGATAWNAEKHDKLPRGSPRSRQM